MSVINKVLRDLDQRQAANRAASPVSVAQPQTMLRRGTTSVPSAFSTSAASGSRWVRWLVALCVVAALAAAGWWWQATGMAVPQLAPVDATPAPAVVVATPAPAPVPSASAPVVVPVAQSVAAASAAQPPIQLIDPTPVAQASQVVKPVAAAAPAVADAKPAAPIALRMESALTSRKMTGSTLSTPAAVVPVAPAPESAPVVQRQQQAGGDAIAQAQSLWNTGSRDAAIDLMQQSVAAAERAAKAGGAAGSTPLLVLLTREMARMQMAEARYGAVWEWLSRLEPLLGNQPDLWAIRANAAQRLGRHQDSVHAYTMALQSRPNEQRWMLGAAVSLAALGQTASAADMAERARSAGPISRDVLAYLRQMGVPIKDQ